LRIRNKSSNTVYHIIYISYVPTPLYDDDLVNILTKSRFNNKMLDITGMLIYVNGKFIQVLEGEYDSVTKMYEKIKNDSRHRQVFRLMEGNSDDRIFKDWSMGFKKLTENQFLELSGFKDPEDFFNANQINYQSPSVLVFLELFYKNYLNDYPEGAIN